MGVIEEAGPNVSEVKEGDRVVIPCNISCGRCWFCRHELGMSLETSILL
jgi:S-(hydroxymethyl)glutathione dehydrogenase/alcohol dehydrogenase